MNKLEDAPELKAEFEKVSHEFGLLFAPESYRITAEHFFIAGRNSVRKQCESVKTNRKIADLFEHDGDLYAVSNDGKLYSAPCWVYGNKMTRPTQWHKWPEIPQD